MPSATKREMGSRRKHRSSDNGNSGRRSCGVANNVLADAGANKSAGAGIGTADAACGFFALRIWWDGMISCSGIREPNDALKANRRAILFDVELLARRLDVDADLWYFARALDVIVERALA